MSTPQSGTGLPANIAGALSYLFGAVTGAIFYALEKDKFVRFHALQSIGLTVAWIAVWIVFAVVTAILGNIPVLGGILEILLSLGLGLGFLALVLWCMWNAYQGKQWRVPYLADLVEKYAPTA